MDEIMVSAEAKEAFINITGLTLKEADYLRVLLGTTTGNTCTKLYFALDDELKRLGVDEGFFIHGGFEVEELKK